MTSTDPAQQASKGLVSRRQGSRAVRTEAAVQEDITQGHRLKFPNSWEFVVLNTLQLLFSSLQVKIAQLPRNLGVVISSRETDAQICC